ncbi:hypothetical protein H8959_012029 [Pygathrix nigripes]
MKALRLSASALFCLLLIKGLGAAPPGRPEAQPPPLSSEHKEPVAGDAVPGPKDGSAPEVRAARNSEPQDEGELFQGVDPRALAAVLLQALDRPASPPAPSGSQQGPAEEAAEALLTETVRSQTHSLPAPESPEPAAPPRPQTPENGPEAQLLTRLHPVSQDLSCSPHMRFMCYSAGRENCGCKNGTWPLRTRNGRRWVRELSRCPGSQAQDVQLLEWRDLKVVIRDMPASTSAAPSRAKTMSSSHWS